MCFIPSVCELVRLELAAQQKTLHQYLSVSNYFVLLHDLKDTQSVFAIRPNRVHLTRNLIAL